MLFRSNPFLVIKGGIFEGKQVTTAEIMKLADLESREVLLAKLAGAMKASMSKAARAFDALRIKREAEAGAPAAASTPAAEAAPVAEATTPEAVTEVVADAQAETSAEPAQAEVTTETSEPTENA